ncbi:hypothetical protein NC652_020116 [Populus alba x Populus x berolinensis]|uniref:Uncharacterized protein n=1 Tax=Populus alba x Populus x berolinensis TaxID=444605 RepID=A0AAD6MJC1_9ROSI|nr:hypothetical protein NC652_020087 [Populus alba x Populus x berolinensis]KAJ6909047.1 hypothetical protein NC652_020116 [Populus alba x Populus x berolinensis]KAJ6986553.1 hypothetical protein NC653_019924 [Populus alba x Populus x berolinensis]KAJ6986582.1 hypothetical protein NC653_019950 [Populus alba x Populus x berolinensis]
MILPLMSKGSNFRSDGDVGCEILGISRKENLYEALHHKEFVKGKLKSVVLTITGMKMLSWNLLEADSRDEGENEETAEEKEVESEQEAAAIPTSSKNNLSDLTPRTTTSNDSPSKPSDSVEKLVVSDEFVNHDSGVSTLSEGSKKTEFTVLITSSPPLKERVLGCLHEGHFCHGCFVSLILNSVGIFIFLDLKH